MFHAVVACGVEGKVTDYRSDAEHIGTDHKTNYDIHKPAIKKLSWKNRYGNITRYLL